MRKVLFIAAMFLTGFVASAQQSLGEGNLQINGGAGFSSFVGVPIYLGADYGVHQDVTAGVQVGFSRAKNPLFGEANAISVAVKGDYHFNRLLDLPEQWDLYAGVSLGYRTEVFVLPSGFAYGSQLGVRYFFNDKWGVNLQYGGSFYGWGAGQIGVTYKL